MTVYPSPTFQDVAILGTIDRPATIAATGTETAITITGFNSALVNMGTVATTIDINGGYVGQEARLEIKQGSTARAASLGTTVAFGSTYSSFTSTNSANAVDMVDLVCAQSGTIWRVDNISQGFTV